MNKIILGFLIIILIIFVLGIKKIFYPRNLEKELHYIPFGYTGEIFIYFNYRNGLKREYEDKRRVYRIQYNGFCFTRFKPNVGWTDGDSTFKFVCVDSALGDILNISRIDRLTKEQISTIDSNNIVVHSMRYGICYDSITKSNYNCFAYQVDTLKDTPIFDY